MRLFSTLCTLLLAASRMTMALDIPKTAAAHFMVGNSAAYGLAEWADDMQRAKQAGLDAFALNVGPNDAWTDKQLQNAISAAEQKNFKLFLSFDFAAGPWSADVMVAKIQKLSASPSQLKFDNRPVVSTFEGTEAASTIQAVRQRQPIFFIPDWTSMGPYNFKSVVGQVDGAFNWASWPEGANNMNTDGDKAWMSTLGNKPYMMGVSPWFYTNLQQYNKNWLWRGDDLWHDRWMQVIQLQPALVEVITWNDYGESHYIGPLRAPGVVNGAQKFVNDMPHEGFLESLSYYISAWKNNGKFPVVGTEKVTYWYRTSPASACSSDGTKGNAPWQRQLDPTTVVQDQIFVTVLLRQPAQVTVQVGSNAKTVKQINFAGLNHFSVPLNGQTGNSVAFAIVRNGQNVVTGTGKGISNSCPNGKTNFNVWVGNS